MPFPLASPSEGSYREPEYQQRIEVYAQNYFTPAEYQKIKSRGISFVRGDADMIRHAFIGEYAIKRKVQEFTGSAYVFDLAHALLLQVKRTVQQLVNVPEGLNTRTLMAVLYNLKGFKLMKATALAPQTGTGEASPNVQLTALSSSNYQDLASQGSVRIKGGYYTPVRVPLAGRPQDAYPWSLTDDGQVAVDCVVAQLLEVCRSRTIDPTDFSLAQRAGVFTPLDLDASNASRYGMGKRGEKDVNQTFGYRYRDLSPERIQM